MQDTTNNPPYHENGDANYTSVDLWLGALYSDVSQKNAIKDFSFLNIIDLDSVKNLEKSIEYNFKNSELLINALTQSTFYYEFKYLNNSHISSNERLEFLGDSLVNFLVAKLLFNLYPELNEGNLSKLRGSLVNESSLSRLATAISLGENLLLGKGEHKGQGLLKESLLADAFEALIAAIYIDSGENIASLEKTLLSIIKKYETKECVEFFASENLELFDSKTKLQEIAMAQFRILPTYKSIEDKNGFTVSLWIGDKKLAEAQGPSKKKIEKELARVVLDEKRYQ